MDSSQQFDLIVVGGGPGGSTLAALVALQGHRVLLLERERFPRYQIGESLLPPTIHGICRLTGAYEEVLAAGFVRKNGAAFRWGQSAEPWVFGFNQARTLDAVGANYSFQVERAKFDHILLNNARRRGAEVCEGCSVNELISIDGRVAGAVYTDAEGRKRTARARWVADASGNTSRLFREVGERRFSSFFRNVALFTYFEGAGRMPPPLSGNILCEAFSRGWMWFIPLGNGEPSLTSVGAVIDNSHAAEIQGEPERALRGFIDQCPRIQKLLSTAARVTEGIYGRFRVRKDWSYTNERFWIPGALLIGDAACFIDPVLSTGVHFATYSALLAARSINSCLRGDLDERTAFDEFERRYRMEYELFYNYLIAFYDMNGDQESYYWKARSVLETEERANEAFVRLVAGGATAPELYFQHKLGIGPTMQELVRELEVTPGADEVPQPAVGIYQKLHRFEVPHADRPFLAGFDDLRHFGWSKDQGVDFPSPPSSATGLMPSPDGMHWMKIG